MADKYTQRRSESWFTDMAVPAGRRLEHYDQEHAKVLKHGVHGVGERISKASERGLREWGKT
jgi:hypothetical protein